MILKFNDNLKNLLLQNNKTQQQLADFLNTTQQTISRWIKGSNQPDFYNLLKMADYFDCSVDYLLGREDDFGVVQSSAPNSLTALESELLSLFRALDTSAQHKAIGYVYALGH